MNQHNINLVINSLELIRWSKETPQWLSLPEYRSLLLEKGYSDYGEVIDGVCITIVVFLDLLGIIEWDDQKFRLKGQIPYYFRNNLIWYLQNRENIFANWNSKGNGNDFNLENVMGKGCYILYLLEQRRIYLSKKHHYQSGYSRQQDVAITLLKTTFNGKPYFLYQWDKYSKQYQLIGGRRKENEPITDTAIREFKEEVDTISMLHNRDFRIEELVSNIEIKEISQTYGALTKYNFSLFWVALTLPQLRMSQLDRWISLDDMKRGKTKDGYSVTNTRFFRLFDQSLPDGFEGVKDSLSVSHIANFHDHVC